MDPTALVRLHGLMALTPGRAELAVGIIDGPVAVEHPHFHSKGFRSLPGHSGVCRGHGDLSCEHGTLVTGVLAAHRDSPVRGIAPDATYILRPIFPEDGRSLGGRPVAAPQELSAAIVGCVSAGAKVLNLSVAVAGGGLQGDPDLRDAVDYASSRGVLIVTAVAKSPQNRPIDGSFAQAIPVVAYDADGRPMQPSPYGASIGRGIAGPGQSVLSLSGSEGTTTGSGTSVSVPFVTGAIVLLWSMFPQLGSADIKNALLQGASKGKRSLIPPLMNAWSSYLLLAAHTGKEVHHEFVPIASPGARKEVATTHYTSPRL